MNALIHPTAALNVRDQFPALPADWHYLDAAATAQKPQAVIDAITNGYARAITPPCIAGCIGGRRT